VTVYTHSWRADAEHLAWSSDGVSGYEIREAPGQRRGCKVVVHLRDEYGEFANESRVREVLRSYSNFVPFPINLNGERVNTVEALWLKGRKDISDEEYEGFYRFVAGAADGPRMRLHFSADAPIALNALLFVPGENPERFGFGQSEPGVALYCRKVLIDRHPRGLLPEWLRFLRGVVDSEDLPLNISRETMQDSALVHKLNRVITRRFLKHLEGVAKDSPEEYTDFYQRFSRFLKEGVATDFAHREQIAKLLRFESSMLEPGALTGLGDYLARAKDSQQAVYYQIAPSRAAAEAGPYLEAFTARGLEVLLLYEAIDDYVAGSLHQFDGKELVPVDRSDIDLGDAAPPAETEGEALGQDEMDRLCTWMQGTLGEPVSAVRPSRRLVGSPAAALTPPGAPSPQLRQMMKALNPGGPDQPPKVELEINPRHPLVKNLAATSATNPDLAKLVAAQLLDNALLNAGLLEDTHTMARRLNTLLEEVVKPR
jgi:molecular chaperone HtpG